MQRRGFAILLTLFMCVGTAGSQEPAITAKINAAVQPFVDRQELAGAVMLVADPERILSLSAVGYADISANKPMDTMLDRPQKNRFASNKLRSSERRFLGLRIARSDEQS